MKKKKKFRRILVFLIVLLISFSIYLYFGLKMLDIEDRYGDLENIYWNSKNDDIALNKKNSECALIRKEKNRVYVIKNQRKLDIDYWLNPQNADYDVEVYRPKNKIALYKLTSEELYSLTKNSETKLIEKIEVNY